MIVRQTRRARSNIETILTGLEQKSPLGASRVAASMKKTMQLISDFPRAGKQTSKPSLFVKILADYPYKIFYLIKGDIVEIIHVRHAARRPWHEIF